MRPDRLLPRRPTTTAAAKVLVVDDDDSMCELLARWTTALGHDVEIALDAQAALDILQTRSVDVVLADIMMPGRDGVWLIDQITHEHFDIPVIVVTGLTEMDPRVTLRQGVEAYLVKPVNFVEFRATLDDVLKSSGEPLGIPLGEFRGPVGVVGQCPFLRQRQPAPSDRDDRLAGGLDDLDPINRRRFDDPVRVKGRLGAGVPHVPADERAGVRDVARIAQTCTEMERLALVGTSEPDRRTDTQHRPSCGPHFDMSRVALQSLRPSLFRRIAIGCAALSIAIGVIAIVLWLLDLQPEFGGAATSASTVLCLALLGVAVIGAVTRGSTSAAVISGCVLALGTDTLLSSVSTATFRMREMLAQVLMAAGLPDSGGLTPQLALCAIGMSVAILGFLRSARPALPAMIASLVAACGAMSMLGYGVDLEPLYGWSGVGRMALDTALTVTILSVGLLAGIAADTMHREPALVPEWLPFPIGVFTATGGLILWHATTAELILRQVRPINAGSASTLIVATAASVLTAAVAQLWVIAQHRKTQLERTLQALAHSEGKIRTLSRLIPICAWCKSIRNDTGYWNRVEEYLSADGHVDFTHAICPSCSQAQADAIPAGSSVRSSTS